MENDAYRRLEGSFKVEGADKSELTFRIRPKRYSEKNHAGSKTIIRQIQKPSANLYVDNFGSYTVSNVEVPLAKSADMSVADLYEMVVSEIRSQHCDTRKHVTKTSEEATTEIISSIKDNSVVAVELLSKIALVFALFVITAQILTGIWLMNFWLALAIAFSAAAGWGMAAIKRKWPNV